MAKILALSELLIDFIQQKEIVGENPFYEACPGGAPCNLLAMAQKLDNQTTFIGKIGKDSFGEQLETVISKIGINTSGLIKTSEKNTTVSIVSHDKTGDRSFSFFRGADALLCEEEIDPRLFENQDVFHFGTLSMTNDICKAATFKAIDIAKENHLIISCDPNLRANLWSNLDQAKEAFKESFEVCNILKISDNELRWFTGIYNLDSAINDLRSNYNIDLILLTLGKDGSKAYYNDYYASAETFLNIPCVDTTGAGDSFMGCALSEIMKIGIENLNNENLKEILLFSNAAASLVAGKRVLLKLFLLLKKFKH